jgi:hypothetical protein
MTRGKSRYHIPVGKRPFAWNKSRHTQLQERREEIQRDIKRKMLEKGIIEVQTPPVWEWRYGEEFGVVVGFTKSEARSKIKKKLGIPKKKSLPSSVQIRKVEFNEPAA